MNSPKVRIVEVGYDTNDYEAGHISGSVGWAWSTDCQHPIRKDFPDKAGMEELLVRSGIENDTTIIVYGARHHRRTRVIRSQPEIGHGDSLVIYTDGTPDALNSRGEEYGMTRLIEAVASLRASDAKLQLDRLSEELEDFIGDTSPFDDVTFFILAREEG